MLGRLESFVVPPVQGIGTGIQFLCAKFLFLEKLGYRTMDYQTTFLGLLDYWNTKYQTTK
jgi:hypothetical protein